MDVPWWGWLAVAVWCTVGGLGFVVGALLLFESPAALRYYFVDDRGVQPLWFVRRLIPLAATFAMFLLVGPILLALELLGRPERRRREQMREQGRQRRRARRLARQQSHSL